MMYPDAPAGTPLYAPPGMASELGNLRITQLLIGRGAVVDAAKKTADTPLIIGCSKGDERVAHRLLDTGAAVIRAQHAKKDT